MLRQRFFVRVFAVWCLHACVCWLAGSARPLTCSAVVWLAGCARESRDLWFFGAFRCSRGEGVSGSAVAASR